MNDPLHDNCIERPGSLLPGTSNTKPTSTQAASSLGVQQSPPLHASRLRRIRLCLAIVIVGLLISGVTAFPLETELRLLARVLNIPSDTSAAHLGAFRAWIAAVRDGLIATNARYPFLAYGTDWLAFAHILFAILFIGPYRDPVRNAWIIDFGLISCVGVVLLAMIAGPIRGIPFGWRCIDSSFGVFAAVPLGIARNAITSKSGDS